MTGNTSGRTPGIVGAAQVRQRPDDWSGPEEARGPIELMVQAAREAAYDAGTPELLERLDWVGVVGGLWVHQDPGRLIAEAVGSPEARTALSTISGSAPQELVGMAADRIARGEIQVALVVGGEAAAAERGLRRAGQEPAWDVRSGLSDAQSGPEAVGELPDDMLDEARLFGPAATAYALFEDSLRVAAERSPAEQREHAAELWAGFSRVAAGNPYAWDRTPHTVVAIATATTDNRMIAFPYTKAMVAENGVDLASAVLLCSLEVARSVGAADALVFPWVSTSSHETWLIAQRDVLHETPGLTAAGHSAFEATGLRPGDLTHVDLYACFPSIVQMSSTALGLDPGRTLTVTGGLGFAGAAVANSSGHAIAAMVRLLRHDGGASGQPRTGLVHANGGYATKHAIGVYADRPPPGGYHLLRVADGVDLRARGVLPAAELDQARGALVEAATVVFDRTGPSHAFLAVRAGPADSAARALVRSGDPALIEQVLSDGLAGRPFPGAVSSPGATGPVGSPERREARPGVPPGAP